MTPPCVRALDGIVIVMRPATTLTLGLLLLVILVAGTVSLLQL